MTSTVHPIHFEDYSGTQFERLVFAYHVRAGGIEEFEDRPARKTIIQCANRDTLILAKARTDMEKAVAAGGSKPDAFKFVCRGAVSDASRTRIGKAAAALSVEHVTIWSSVEFEDNLRMCAEYLLHRFVRGVEIPEAEAEIRKFVVDFPNLSDADALGLMAAVFDRPAFRTPFRQESSLPAFQQAIEDTIGALNSGVWRTREGRDIRRIPSIHHIKDQRARKVLTQVVRQVDELRRIFASRLSPLAFETARFGLVDAVRRAAQPT